jgi:hypothetical protein
MRSCFAATRLAGNHAGMYGAVDLASEDVAVARTRAALKPTPPSRRDKSAMTTTRKRSDGFRYARKLLLQFRPRSPDRPPRVWKFWGTTLWGLFIFAAMFLGQVAVIAYFVLRQADRSTSPKRSVSSAAA